MRRLLAPSVILACTILCAAAHADGDDQTPQGEPPATAAPPPQAPPPKAPAPPLFPKHRRGMYHNSEGVEVVDATPQSPPLETDDPNVPDKGEWEINLTTLGDLSKETKQVELLLVDTNYGLLPKIAGHELPTQLKCEFPLTVQSSNGDPFGFGVGPANVGVKLNFYRNEQTGLSIAVYPQVEFALPGSDPVSNGLAEPGQEFILPLLVSKEFREFSFVTNAGLEQPWHNPDGELTGTFGVGFGRAFTRRVAAMIELRGESSFSEGGERLMFLNVGVIRGVRNIILYAKWGHSLASSDDVSHNYLGVGMKLHVQGRHLE